MISRDVGQQLVQVERLRGGRRHLQQEIEQLGALLETDGGFAGGLHGLLYGVRMARQAAAASTILTLALAPMRDGAGGGHGPKIGQRANAARRFHAHVRPDDLAHQRDIVRGGAGRCRSRSRS